ncbi:hypothetical protein AMTR_s00044p00091920, partial [Amborella trichopoda]
MVHDLVVRNSLIWNALPYNQGFRSLYLIMNEPHSPDHKSSSLPCSVRSLPIPELLSIPFPTTSFLAKSEQGKAIFHIGTNSVESSFQLLIKNFDTSEGIPSRHINRWSKRGRLYSGPMSAMNPQTLVN